ncbi:trans-sulfuration enzyme family protein [Hoeflea ulvae]|uniref:Aminotransferase class I/II-fold pyridoxal phosphate-dependent enzyme n=1 Tax=Hoeflea ulvae TaxID=2983764 RepID=A0ABT3YCN9_9HYPH|nr:aminotransferase class I/II-fold pyridoxal phosphate-dependent enzyme [Hoeflea ulvae]MCY0093452.1 aminotransferase class I/II-fold pyridoxal phosphate-dependent enzyme [Hoeflea ulvae]
MTKDNLLGGTGPATRAIHLGYDPATENGALTPPIYLTSTYAFETAEDGVATFAGERTGYVYGRAKNPTQALLEARVADLESGEAGLALASGIAAITATVLTLVKAGDRVLVDQVIYGCSYSFFANQITRFGVEVIFADFTDLDSLEAEFAKNPALVFFETPSNPNVRIIDIVKVSAMSKAAGAVCVVDNTFSSPIIQQPLAFGADIVVHSATKFLGGHGDLLGGIVVGTADMIFRIRNAGLRMITGATLSAFNAFLILRGLKTLSLRMKAHCSSALAIAEHMSAHPMVAKVLYPMLPGFEQRELAQSQMSGGGAIVSFQLVGGRDMGMRFINALELIKCAVSLGDAETLVQLPAGMTHATYTPEERLRFGIPEDLVRLSVGLEDLDDLILDINRAFETIASQPARDGQGK